VQADPELVYNDDIPEGGVIGISAEGEIRPHDTVLLRVSRGPEPVPVPEIVGLSWYEARTKLAEAGLDFEYWNTKSRVLGESLPSEVTVEEISPEEGAEVRKGTKIKVRLD